MSTWTAYERAGQRTRYGPILDTCVRMFTLADMTTRPVTTRVTLDEYDELVAEAAASGRTLSAYLAHLIRMGRRPPF